MNPLRRFLELARPRVETADEFLGGDPLHPRPAASGPEPPRPLGRRRRGGPGVVLVVVALLFVAVGVVVWLTVQRPFEPAPTLDSDALTRFATGQGLACAPPTHDEIGYHWSCHAVDGTSRTLDWYGPTSRRATVLQASAGPSISQPAAAGYLSGVARLGVPSGRQADAAQWVTDHLSRGQTTFGSVQVSTGGAGAPSGTYSVNVDQG